MDSAWSSMQNSLQDALDDLVSSRSSVARQGRALNALEHILALACLQKSPCDDVGVFFSLQDTFECNVPSRVLVWISVSTTRLELLASKGSTNSERESEASALSVQLSQALSIVQGVALKHAPSKRQLGRQYSLEILLDLMLASRHLAAMPNAQTRKEKGTPEIPVLLTSAVIDTLLCILVDSPPALRLFEEVNGVQAVVKLLKRAGMPREVRMKCLEFLYFYLLDETPVSPALNATANMQSPPSYHATYLPPATLSNPLRTAVKEEFFPSTAPSTPVRNSAPFGSRYQIRAEMGAPRVRSLSSTSYLSGHRSTSTSSSTSASSSSSSANSNPMSSTATSADTPSAHPLLMLRKEVNYVPLSPKKPAYPGTPRGIATSSSHSHKRGMSWLGPFRETDHSQEEERAEENAPCVLQFSPKQDKDKDRYTAHLRTTEQKKNMLGELLGNVDALVEGVRKAGIWGLS